MAHETIPVNESLSVIAVSREIESGNRTTVNLLRDMCGNEIANGHDVVVDFGSANICPSIVWGNMIVLAKRAASAGRRISICCLRPTVDKTVRIIGMAKYIDIFENREEAVSSYSKGEEDVRS